MTFSRRRFLTISAAVALTPRSAFAERWQGHAFGAEVSLTIRGPKEVAGPALQDALSALRDVERLFSLYDPASDLSRLNAYGRLHNPDARFLELMHGAQAAFDLTNGLFDPTVQPLWKALAKGQDADAVRGLVGWERIQFDAAWVQLGPGQALTFNGIAQGFATDIVAEILASHGLQDVLINIGEYRARGGPWKLALRDPTYGEMGTRTLGTGAIATSSPLATTLGAQGHILHRSAQPLWSTVSVEAPSATLADSLSTAMVLATRDEIDTIRDKADLTRVTLVDHSGDLITL
ncbi:thiamine biosynthesis lipoprotein [Litoreibacter ponti]|uniref:FAD:protein FMN transferase n=1 Tax=Litoreibacter ponti TaxID=1510457 RepID=A0A2T6BF14_9RHOB|nr:FAD:protein FMN transferase [Litoreibacter ponti]PTX54662.1 thiamine biosynthesis lipoprotein [Litoreibacter ponti]